MRGFVRSIVLVCAMAAMGIRAATPPGYMFADNANGPAVTLCAGMDMPASGDKQQPAPGHQTEHAPCLFAAAAHAAPAPTAIAPVPILIATVFAPNAPAAVSVGQGLAAPPPPSTGPPQLT